MAASMSENVCQTTDCDKVAKFRCPTCIKLNIEGSNFCSQECFKGFWSEHKLVHRQIDPLQQLINETTSQTIKLPEHFRGYTFTGKLRPWNITSKREVGDHIQRPDYAHHPEGFSSGEQSARGTSYTKVLDEEEIEGVRVAGKLGREVLDIAAAAIEVGVTTDEIDRLVHEACVDRDCYPSPLNYYNFPKSCCTSINEVICHGIPDLRPLEDGDICNVDITVFHRGFHGDLNETFFVGNVPERAKQLVTNAHECLVKAIEIVKPGTKYRDVGNVIQNHAQQAGFSVVKTYCGHGIHRLFHTAPNVPHYGKNKAVGLMKPGHCFTIEPMISEGTWRDVMWPDNWTAVTQDGKLSAQFEHTLLVTETGCDILTKRLEKGGQPHFMDQSS